MKTKIILLLITSISLYSCNKFKNNKAERKLEGEWQLVKSEYGDKEIDLTDREQIITFYDSNDKEHYEETIHYGQMKNSYKGYTYYSNFKYFVTEKGKLLNMYLEFNSPTSASIYVHSISDLTKLNGNKLVFEGENADGLISKFTFKKL